MTIAEIVEASEERIRTAAFRAASASALAAAVYSFVITLIELSGTQRGLMALATCAAGVLALVMLERPASVIAAIRRGPMPVTIVAAVLGLLFLLVGREGRLLFLPVVLIGIAVAAVCPPKRLLAAVVLLAAGTLASGVAGRFGSDASRWLLAGMLTGLVVLPLAASRIVDLAVQRMGKPAVTAPSKTPDSRFGLTPRQIEVVRLAGQGLRQAEIAKVLGVSIHQVRRLLGQARERTGSSNSRALVAWAVEAGLFDADQSEPGPGGLRVDAAGQG